MAKDIKLGMNTQEGLAMVTTGKVNAELLAIYVNSNDQVSISVDSELGYRLFEKRDHIGIKYYAIKTPTTSNLGNIHTDHLTTYYLNEKLIIMVEGAKNKDVEIILRVMP